MHVYLDNSATTVVREAAAKKAYDVMTATFGNPSSLHTLGIRAEQELTDARRAVASLLGLSSGGTDLSCITFTSGGTEANNLALFGAANANKRLGKHIVTTAVEHPSVLEAMKQLEREGFELTVVSPDARGDFDARTLAQACREDTVLVGMMLVNNEIGTLLPVKEAIPLIRKRAPHAHVHCDAVQAAGKLPVKVLSLDADTVSISGHKLHAPKGVGALYVKRGVRLLPRLYGGGQERKLRPGTEAVPAIAAFGEAIRLLPSPATQMARFSALSDQLEQGLSAIDRVVLHTPVRHVPYIRNLSVCGFKSETLVHFLAQRGIYVSAGSACAKGHDSHVLSALGLPPEQISSALRISLCADNTADDIQTFLDALNDAVATLAHV
ncbi:MAG: cysteine desulfurase [Ruminococcaceae bacterium]|nr:cysteine desulfurase [Oscillospiraceae bacterium]